MDLPDIGKLDRLITILKQQDMPAMNAGIDTSYTDQVTAWAKIEPVGSAIFFGTKQIESGVTHRILVRRTSLVTESTITGDHVVRYSGLLYRVRRAADLNGMRRFVMLECEELGDG